MDVKDILYKGSYTWTFWQDTGYNLLRGITWVGAKEVEEDPKFKVRLSEVYDFGWDGMPIPKYLKKPKFEELFGIRLTMEERCDPNLIAAFYTYGDYRRVGAIFDVRKLLLTERISTFMELKYGEEWVWLHIDLLAYETQKAPYGNP